MGNIDELGQEVKSLLAEMKQITDDGKSTSNANRLVEKAEELRSVYNQLENS